MVQAVDNETPTLEQVLQRAIERRLSEMHTAIPARIESFDGTKASVQPLLKRKLLDGTLIDLPIVTNVPILWQRTGKAFITFPIKAGDTGTLLVAERSIDTWLVAGGLVSPEDPRKFNLSDGMFLPGLYPNNDAPTVDLDRITIQNDKAKITLKPDGTFAITNGTEELIDLVSQIADLCSTMTTNTFFGPLQVNQFATFATIKSKVDTLKE